jgi:exocyst complex component 8
LPDYIFQISFIYFTIIKNTVSIYQSCFPPVMMSACVKWAKEHVDNFNRILSRQLTSLDAESNVWRECMDQAHTHAALLAEVGLDFKDLIGKAVESEAGENPEALRPVGLGVS